MATVFLHAPQDFTNVCVIARTLEAFGVPSCAVLDQHRLIRPHYGKSYARRLRNVSAGAFSKVRWQTVDDLFVFGSERHGIPADVTAACGLECTIPTSGETQSLNLAVAVGIVVAEYVRQTGVERVGARVRPAHGGIW